MKASVELIRHLADAVEAEAANWKNGHGDAVARQDIEEIIDVGIRIFIALRDAFTAIQRISARVRDAEEFDNVILAKEVALLNQAFCKSFKPFEQAIMQVRGQGHEVPGSEQFLGYLRETERALTRWLSEQEKAMALRAQWMRVAGLAEDEIKEHCDPLKYPADLRQEEDNVAAQQSMAALADSETLWAKHIARRGQSASTS